MTQRQVAGKIFSSRQFKYDSAKRQFTSTIQETPEILRQLWEDSLDLGFGIRSERTKQVVFFTLESVERRGTTYQSWLFRVYNPSSDPRLSDLTVCVLNLKE